MNRLLVIVVVLLVPVAVLTYDDTEFVYNENIENNISLELAKINDGIKKSDEVVKKEIKEEPKTQVLVSNNKDKSSPYSVDLEDYIIGVVAGEMPASFNMEALKAQAVAARSYALYKQKNIKGYVLSASINDQVYLSEEQMKSKWGSDYEYYYERVKKAVNDTKGEVMTYNDQVIIAYYFAISNGFTESSSTVFNETKDYLVSVPSEWDKNYQSYTSTASMLRENFCSRLNINCDNIVISNVERGSNNYVRKITINNQVFTGLQIFNKLNLKSTDFTITVNGGEVLIKTNGFGHGVGMSQYGAQGMANNGSNYKDILKHYYQNVKITNI